MNETPALNELKTYPQWVKWRMEPDKDGKPTKVLKRADGMGNAKSNDRTTWSPPEAIHEEELTSERGVGFVVSAEDSFCGIDLDHCRDAVTGEVEPWAMEIVNRYPSYTEITPSQTGLRIWVLGAWPNHWNKWNNPPGSTHPDAKVEVYDRKRFFTVTGDHLAGTPGTIEEFDLSGLHFTKPPKPRPGPRVAPGTAPALTSFEIIGLANAASNGDKFERLMRGDTSAHPSHSEADLALCCILAFWTQDPQQIDQIFRTSGLMHEKWERPDYREITILKALELVTDHYSGPAAPLPRPSTTEVHDHLRGMNAAELLALDLPDLYEHFAGLLPEGLGVIGAPPKAGKSLLAYQFGGELVTGGAVLGIRTQGRTPVLYYALEDGKRRSKKRVREVLKGRTSGIENLDLRWTAPRLGAGLEEEIATWLKGHSHGVVIIDVLAKVRPQGKAGLNAYDEDYSALTAIHNVARSHPGSTILIVTHDRKAGSEDWMTRLTGTRGVTGAADFIIFIQRKRTETFGTIFVTGRDIPDTSIDVNFTGSGWERATVLSRVEQESSTRQIFSIGWPSTGRLNP